MVRYSLVGRPWALASVSRAQVRVPGRRVSVLLDGDPADDVHAERSIVAVAGLDIVPCCPDEHASNAADVIVRRVLREDVLLVPIEERLGRLVHHLAIDLASPVRQARRKRGVFTLGGPQEGRPERPHRNWRLHQVTSMIFSAAPVKFQNPALILILSPVSRPRAMRLHHATPSTVVSRRRGR